MTSTGGLSRRRVAASGSNNDDADDAWGLNGGGSSSHSSNPSISSTPIPGSTSHAGTAFQGGSKIAYDPRDLEREDEDIRQGGKAPKLTIMEEVLLLGLKDKQVCFCRATNIVVSTCNSPLMPQITVLLNYIVVLPRAVDECAESDFRYISSYMFLLAGLPVILE